MDTGETHKIVRGTFERNIDRHTRLLFDAVKSAGLGPLPTRACKMCRGRRRWDWWSQGSSAGQRRGERPDWDAWLRIGSDLTVTRPGSPWPVGQLVIRQQRNDDRIAHMWRSAITGPCPACSVVRTPAGAVLHAANAEDENPVRPTAIAELAVLADRLQAGGDPIGTAIALWLAGRDDMAGWLEQYVSENSQQ